MIAAIRAFARGMVTVIRAPGAVLLTVIATLLTVLPFALVLGNQLQAALAHQPAIDLAAQEIDAEWWMEYRRHASGLAATFTPAIIGFAAPLETLSALLDGSPRPWVLAIPIVLHAIVWAFLWGALLPRLSTPRLTVREAFAAGKRHFVSFVAISLIAGLALVVLFLTVHAWLFGPVDDFIRARTQTEPAAFAGRVSLYLVFGALLAAVSLIADYARVALVTGRARSVRTAVAESLQILRSHAGPVVLLLLLTLAVLTLAFAAYGIADQRFGGWRAVLLGQAFIIGRLVLRLVNAAAQLHLVRDLTRASR